MIFASASHEKALVIVKTDCETDALHNTEL